MESFPAIILARMSSSRLPGKSLTLINGKELIRYVVETLQHTNVVSDVCIATSDVDSDSAIEDFARTFGVECYRGNLENVAERFVNAAGRYNAPGAYRVNGDSPLISRQLFERASKSFDKNGVDLVTNVFPRTYPPGVSVELVRLSAMQDALMKMTQENQEHVTQYIYQNDGDFRIENLHGENDFSNCHFAIDTAHDMAVFEEITRLMDRPHWEYSIEEVVRLYQVVTDKP